jgi:hypothetical protein
MTDGEAGPYPADDPPPLQPRRPEPQECCDSGCDPCVFDLYAQAMEEYEAALAAWERRRATRSTSE